MKLMVFSIIVPVRNAEKTLERCVSSIAGQGKMEMEIILIENGSEDTSYLECMRLKSRYETDRCTILCVQAQNQGISSARNIGLDMATGDIICFCDADDYLEDDVFRFIERLFLETNADLIITGYLVHSPDSVISRSLPEERYIAQAELMGRILNDSRVFGSVWNKYYKREMIQNYRFEETLTLCEDTHFNLSVLSRKTDAVAFYTKQCTYHYICNEQSQSHSNDSHNWRSSFRGDKLKYIEACYQILNDCQLPEKTIREVQYAIAGHAIHFLHNFGNEMEPEIREYLKRELRKNLLPFMMVMREYHRGFNIKRLIWGLKWLLIPERKCC